MNHGDIVELEKTLEAKFFYADSAGTVALKRGTTVWVFKGERLARIDRCRDVVVTAIAYAEAL